MDKYKLIAKLNNHTDTTELISYTNNRIIINEETALSLIEHKNDILKQTGRIELSFSALNLIVKTFINSAYIDQHSFKETIYVITEIFYTLKNDTDDMVNDKTLIKLLFDLFENSCKGEIELMHREVAELKEHFYQYQTLKGF